MRYYHLLLVFALMVCLGFSHPALSANKSSTATPSHKVGSRKVGVLLVSHGSHSKQWRTMLMKIEDDVRSKVLKCEVIGGIKSAFMEYTEPSIATRLKEFDEQGYDDVIIVPILLSVSSHSFDDIPVIAGQKRDVKTLETLKLEGIEVYKPRANITVAPLLDFPDVLEKNVLRRVRKMSTDPKTEGVVLVAYGSEPYNEQWETLLERIGKKIESETGIRHTPYCWCGHIVRYKTEPTERAIEQVLQHCETALVIPVLVAVDENFQGRIIGGAIKNVGEKQRIRYRHDAILPDANVNQWVVHISKKLANEITSQPNTAAKNPPPSQGGARGGSTTPGV